MGSMKFECYLVVYLVLLKVLFEVDVSHKFSVWPRGQDSKYCNVYMKSQVGIPSGCLTILFTPFIFANRDIIFTEIFLVGFSIIGIMPLTK